MRIATVIKVKGRERDTLLADPDFVYVGRGFGGFRASDWGNPFKPGQGPSEAWRAIDGILTLDRTTEPRPFFQQFACLGPVERYEVYVRMRLSLRERLPDLVGKALGCWCTTWDGTGDPPMTCHAMVLAKLANALARREG